MFKLKFRAWDKDENKMLESITIKELITRGALCDEKKFKDLEIMQSTGYKDKNGVEIYTDDIVYISLRHWIGADVEYKQLLKKVKTVVLYVGV
jgi:uncharacterized phage protein (TIGR01671 family)